MSRTFTKKINHVELAQKIMKAVNECEDFNADDIKDIDMGVISEVESYRVAWSYKNLTPQVEKDLSKVQFDTENIVASSEDAYVGAKDICGVRTLPNGLTYLGVIAGGDWEYPVFFILYYDGKKLRGYIPKDGNTWNYKTKEAFGNAYKNEDIKLENKIVKKYFGVDSHEDIKGVDCAKIINDIQDTIKYKE